MNISKQSKWQTNLDFSPIPYSDPNPDLKTIANIAKHEESEDVMAIGLHLFFLHLFFLHSPEFHEEFLSLKMKS